jgi:putative ABC transport system substrate-binding protein
MRRREFIISLGTPALWPLAALGQQTPLRTVGILQFGSMEVAKTSFAPAQRRLAEMGFVEGRNLAIEYRGADGYEDRLAALANDLVQRRVDAIAAYGGQPVVAAMAATKSIPIIFFTGYDPVVSGFVASLNRPGGNVSGVSVLNVDVLAKRLQVLSELVPTAKSIAYLYSPTNLVSGYDRIWKDVETAAEALRVKLRLVEVPRREDFEAAFATIANERLDALFVSPDAIMLNNRETVVGLAAAHKIPAVYPIREFAAAGGLVSYGTNYREARRQVGDYLSRVLNGEKPEDLPVLQVTKLELVINMKTANALGLTVPLPLLGRADEVIE